MAHDNSVNEESQLKKAIIACQNFLLRNNGQYFISPAVRSFCLKQVDSGYGTKICEAVIDTIIEEIKNTNIQFETIMKIQQNVTQGEVKSGDAHIQQVSSMILNKWCIDYSNTLNFAISQCIEINYKCKEMNEITKKFLFTRLQTKTLNNLKKKIEMNESASQATKESDDAVAEDQAPECVN